MILVGHSTGGLVIKKVNSQKFLQTIDTHLTRYKKKGVYTFGR